MSNRGKTVTLLPSAEVEPQETPDLYGIYIYESPSRGVCVASNLSKQNAKEMATKLNNIFQGKV